MAAAPCTAVVHGGNNRGRVTVATRLIAPGEIVLTEHAVACVATAGRPLCDDCLTPFLAVNNRNQNCVSCRSLFGSSGSGAPRVSSSLSCAVRLAAKILIRRCSGSLDNQDASGVGRLMCQPDENQRFESSSREDRSSRHEQEEEDYTQVARLVAGVDCIVEDAARPLVVPSTRRGETPVPTDALLDLARKELGRVSLNAINTCDGSGGTGLGLFPEAAMFNHGCRPNCQAWWRGSKLEIRCTKPVAAGQELCFSYIPIDQPSAVRRAQLRDNWFFTCLCEMCVSGQWDAELTGLRCPVVLCSGAVPPPRSTGGHTTSCNKCGSLPAIGPGSGAQQAEQSPPPGSTTATRPPSGRGMTKLAHPPPLSSDAGGGRDGTKTSLGPVAEKQVLSTSEGCEQSLARACAAFGNGMKAYMREDPEVALVALAESLRVRERILHPFNKELLRTLRYASYAAVATRRWALAHSFLSRWLHPMETMFGAAEVWDVAAMRIDHGLVLDKLRATTAVPRRPGTSLQNGSSSTQSDEADGSASSANAAACSELAEGLRWVWICLGRDSGLPAEAAALEACADLGISL